MNTNFRRSVVYFFWLLIFAGSSTLSYAGFDSTAVRIHILSEPETLNPLTSYNLDAVTIELQIFECLLRMDPKTGKLIPWLAEELPTESADHKQFDFKLRKGILFSDGKELTGNDVIFTVKAMKNPFNAAGTNIRSYTDDVQSAELIGGDPYRVRITLSKSGPFMAPSIFGSVLQILPKHVFDPQGLTDKYNWEDLATIIGKKVGASIPDSILNSFSGNPAMKEYGKWVEEFGRGAEDRKNIVGSGPYKLKEWSTNDKIILDRNSRYTNKGNYRYGTVYPNQLIYKEIFDMYSAVTAMIDNEIDVMGYMSIHFFTTIDTVRHPLLRKKGNVQDQYASLSWNLDRPFFKDRKVRLALAHLVDRKTIIDSVLYGLAKPTQSPVFYENPEYNLNLADISFNPDTARLLLKEAGWIDHDGDGIIDKMIDGKSVPFSFTFLIHMGNDIRMKILLMVSDAMRKVGIDTKVERIEWSVYLERIRNHDFDASYAGWANPQGENDSYMLYHSSQSKNGGANHGNWNNPRADQLLEAIRSEFDQAKRYTLQREFQQLFYDEQPATMLWVPFTPVAWSNRFEEPEFFPNTISFDPSQWKLRSGSK